MTQYVAVYGSLRKNFGNNILLKDSTFLGDDQVEGFQMYSLGAFPYVTHTDDSTVKVEVYEVDDTTFKRLDTLEGYPRFYNREQVQTEKGYTCWMYFIDRQEHREHSLVPSGDWLEHRSNYDNNY